MLAIPFEAAEISRYPSRDDWLTEVPRVLATMARRWELDLGNAYVGGVSAAVVSAERRDGTRAVLKVAYPHEEALWEAVGLGAMPPSTVPDVLEQDAWTWSMLLSKVEPGTPLATSELPPADALAIAGELHRRLISARPPLGLPSLATAMEDYADRADRRLADQRADLGRLGVCALVERAIETIRILAADPGESRLLHGDYNPGNILLDTSGKWMAIDPKPLVGDPAYDLWPLVSQVGHPYRSPDVPARLAEQLTIASEAAGCDATRAGAWSFARTGLNVSWYLADGHPEQAAIEAAALSAWAEVTGL